MLKWGDEKAVQKAETLGKLEEGKKAFYENLRWNESPGGPSTNLLAGNDRNILLKYITRSINREGFGEDQFKCEICGKIGGRKDNVLNHVENTHFPGTFDYKCKVCTKRMPTKKSLENHMYRNHKEMNLVEAQYMS